MFQAYHDILEYIKYVSDEDHLKHIPDYLPVYLLSGGFDNYYHVKYLVFYYHKSYIGDLLDHFLLIFDKVL